MDDNLLKLIEIVVPAVVGLAVGCGSSWVSLRQLRQTTDAAEKQIKASLEASMLQYRAQVLSANRQEWINTVRDITAEYLSCAGAEALEHIHSIGKEDGNSTSDDKKALFLRSKLKLLLNPNEKGGQEVLKAMDGLGEWFSLSDPTWKDFTIRKDRFETSVGALLKSEWERVKRGE